MEYNEVGLVLVQVVVHNDEGDDEAGVLLEQVEWDEGGDDILEQAVKNVAVLEQQTS